MALVVLALGLPPAKAMTAAEIDVEVQEKALKDLYAHSETARDFGAVAEGILVFPDVYKAGLMVGGAIWRRGPSEKWKDRGVLPYG